MPISEGCNLETLADTAKLILNDEQEVIYGLSFGTSNFDLPVDCPAEVKSRSCIFQRAVTW